MNHLLCRRVPAGTPRGGIRGGDRSLVQFILFWIIAGAFMFGGDGPVKIYMIGDSTMADKPLDDNPERGWGQLLPSFFDSTAVIENHARNGRCTGSFIREGLWDSVRAKLTRGDFLVIQFGHNDEKKEKGDRYTPPDLYRSNLVRFVNEAREKGASPILCTPIVRRRFDRAGKFYDEHGVYPDIVRGVADSMGVPMLDMHRSSWKLVEGLGEEASKKLFLWIPPGVYASLPAGKEDNTHFSDEGATNMAQLAVDALRSLRHPLAVHLK